MEQTPSKYNFTREDIVTDLDILHQVSEDVTKEEGLEIGNALLKFLETDKSGIGISAIQFGIPKNVCAIYVKEPIILVNPKIEFTEEGVEFPYQEACLSIPGKGKKKVLCNTKRHSSIRVSALNLGENELYSDVTYLVKEGYLRSIDILEMVAVQHEIDHLRGIVISDQTRKWINVPVRVEKIPGRNDIVTAINKTSGEVITVKYKKIVGDKDWEIRNYTPEA